MNKQYTQVLVSMIPGDNIVQDSKIDTNTEEKKSTILQINGGRLRNIPTNNTYHKAYSSFRSILFQIRCLCLPPKTLILSSTDLVEYPELIIHRQRDIFVITAHLISSSVERVIIVVFFKMLLHQQQLYILCFLMHVILYPIRTRDTFFHLNTISPQVH